jgi:hypothetical protein
MIELIQMDYRQATGASDRGGERRLAAVRRADDADARAEIVERHDPALRPPPDRPQ